MIIRKAKHVSFVAIPNSLARNRRLSLETVGLITFMNSFPPDWDFRPAWLMRELAIGRDRLNRMFRESMGEGYLARSDTQDHDEFGRFGSYVYVVGVDPADVRAAVDAISEGVTFSPHAGFPHTGEPHAADQPAEHIKRDNKYGPEGGGGRGVIGSDANALAAELLPIVGIDPTFPPPGWCGLALQVQAWLSDGATADVIRSAFQKASAGRTEPPNTPAYFSKAIARERAIANQPLPTVSAPTTHLAGQRNGTVTSVIEWRKQQKLKRAADAEPGRATESNG